MILAMSKQRFWRKSCGTFLGLAGLVASHALLWRALERITGSCASGGPYVVAQSCPEGVEASVLIAMFGGVACLGVYFFSGFAAGPRLAVLHVPVWILVMAVSGIRDGVASMGEPGFSTVTFVTAIVLALIALLVLGFVGRPKRIRSLLWNDGRVAPRRYKKYLRAARSDARSRGAAMPDAGTLAATNALDAPTVLRMQRWSAMLHVLAIPSGIWLGLAVFAALAR